MILKIKREIKNEWMNALCEPSINIFLPNEATRLALSTVWRPNKQTACSCQLKTWTNCKTDFLGEARAAVVWLWRLPPPIWRERVSDWSATFVDTTSRRRRTSSIVGSWRRQGFCRSTTKTVGSSERRMREKDIWNLKQFIRWK
jgi:hypothetical protein